MHDQLVSSSVSSLKKGSKSFSLAAAFFPRDLYEGAAKIYFWCRYCDDMIDESQGNLKEVLAELRKSTEEVWDKNASPSALPFRALREVSQNFNIPSYYAMELIEGFRMDVEETSYKSLRDLKLYCYRVAGTVGLMMTHAMGVFNTKALQNATALGMAMQMSNIARDVKEDWGRGRVYLPEEWLNSYGVPTNDIFLKPHNLYQAVLKLIEESEKYYEQGKEGIRYLPLRAAWAVNFALHFYREIGREIRRRGPKALESRTVIPFWRKTILALKASVNLAATIPSRLIRNKEIVPINMIWSSYE